jgi:hypothetical protein
MHIIVWFIVITIIIFFYYLTKRQQKRSIIIDGQVLTAEKMWRIADINKESVISESAIEEFLQDERDMIKSMEIDMMRLREIYKNDYKKQLEIAKDWMDYSRAVDQIKSASEYNVLGVEDDDHGSYEESTRDVYLIIKKVLENVATLLGQNSSSKLVYDRIKKNSENKITT